MNAGADSDGRLDCGGGGDGRWLVDASCGGESDNLRSSGGGDVDGA